MSTFRGSHSAGATWASAIDPIPSHITGATAGAARRFAGSEASETCSKCSAISGAVASVAAAVTAIASATGPGTRARRSASPQRGTSASRPTTAAKDSCQPGSPEARGLTASVTTAASPSAYQREAGRPASAATSPAAPITPARWIDGPPPASGTYSATSTSAAPSRTRSGSPSAMPAPSTSIASRTTFWPLTASRCARPDRSKSVRTVVGQPLVLAEHHPGEQRRLGRREPTTEPGLRPPPHGVQRPGKATPPHARRPPPVDLQRRLRAAPALIGVVLPERREPPGHGHDGADRRPSAA